MEQSTKGYDPLQFKFAALTDKGLLRAGNEDAFEFSDKEGIVVVADGMGGYSAGEIASAIASKTVLNYLQKQIHGEVSLERCLKQVKDAIEQADDAIAQAVREVPARRGMGTTIVVGILRNNKLGFAWVGDSRLYLLRNQRLNQLTTDHTLVQELVNQHLFPSIKAAIANGVGENVLTRALGAEGPLTIDMETVGLVKGDILLFCSDGLNHMIDQHSMEQVLNNNKSSLDVKAKSLVRLACDAGGRDNITVVLVEMLAR